MAAKKQRQMEPGLSFTLQKHIPKYVFPPNRLFLLMASPVSSFDPPMKLDLVTSQNTTGNQTYNK